MHGHERRRARGVYGQARAAQIQLVRGEGGQVARMVAGDDGERARAGEHRGIAPDVAPLVVVGAGTAVDADLAVVARRVVSGVLQRGVCQFQKQPLLRVTDLRLAWGHGEERGVEVPDVVEHGGGRYESRVVEVGRRYPECLLLRAGEEADRLDSAGQG